MGKGKFERFSLAAIADALDGSDVATARRSLSVGRRRGVGSFGKSSKARQTRQAMQIGGRAGRRSRVRRFCRLSGQIVKI